MEDQNFTKCLTVTALTLLLLAGLTASALALTDLEQLGKRLFFDPNLSDPPGQSCASCHDPSAGFADPDKHLPVSEGVIAGRFGKRNTPTAAYAIYSRFFAPDPAKGGQFWDGRARTLTEQAMLPFLNPVEMHNTVAGVMQAIKSDPDYQSLFEAAYPGQSWSAKNSILYLKMARAIAAYQSSGEVCQFSSKFDAFWRACKSVGINPLELNGMNPVGILTDMEYMGFLVFKGKGKCTVCHTLDNLVPDPNSPADPPERMPIFTDFKYHNLGIPKNRNNPWLSMPPEFNPDGRRYLDQGLAENSAYYIGTDQYRMAKGRFKTPTLRNVAKTEPYGHNGYFKAENTTMSLMMVVHFYATRDVPGEGWPPLMMSTPANPTKPWPAPEIKDNLNVTDMGNLGLTQPEGMALVQFLNTLEDGFTQP